MFSINRRWLEPPEPEPLPPEDRENRTRVWRFDDHSAMTSTAYACERLGEAEEPGRAAAAEKGWERRRNGGSSSAR